MSRRRVAAITRRLLQQFRRDRRTLALLFGAPLIILGLLGYLLRGGGSVPALGVVNLDDRPLGAALAFQLEQSKNVSATTKSRASAQSKLPTGQRCRLVLLPTD